MKYKMFGVVWDLAPLVNALLMFSFILPATWAWFARDLGWWNVPCFVLFCVYLTIINHVADKLIGGES